MAVSEEDAIPAAKFPKPQIATATLKQANNLWARDRPTTSAKTARARDETPQMRLVNANKLIGYLLIVQKSSARASAHSEGDGTLAASPPFLAPGASENEAQT